MISEIEYVEKAYFSFEYSSLYTEGTFTYKACVARCWIKILSRFKVKPTSSNMMFKRGQHVVSIIVE